MSDITPDTVEKVAHLARLAVSDAEIATYAKDLNKILDLVNEMQSAATQGIEPMVHPWDTVQRFREDTVTETNQRETLQSIAPSASNGLYLVPKVIE